MRVDIPLAEFTEMIILILVCFGSYIEVEKNTNHLLQLVQSLPLEGKLCLASLCLLVAIKLTRQESP